MATTVAPSRPPGRTSRQSLTVVAVGAVALVLIVIGVSFSGRLRSRPAGAIDEPSDGAVLTQPTSVSGWAIDEAAHADTGVDLVQLYIDGKYVGDAYYGVGRLDVGNRFGLQFAASGWSILIDPRQLAGGSHTLQARAHSNVSGQDASYTRTIMIPATTGSSGAVVVSQNGAPAGSVDVPENGAVISGITDVRGWALDARATDGTGVDQVQLYVDDTPVGQAQYGSSRPDVAGQYGQQFLDSGWTTQFDPAGLSTGTHTLEVRAHSSVTGVETAYASTITVQQGTYPRGSIDSPADGQTVSGVITVYGWAVDLASKQDTGVDQVQLYVDGVQFGTADLGRSVPQIGAAYGPQFQISGWAAQVDLSNVSPGSHTLEARARSRLTGKETSYTSNILVD